MQDNPPPLFKHVRVAKWRARGLVGRFAWVSAEIQVDFAKGPAPLGPEYTTFYLTSEDGKWKVVQEGGLSQIVDGGSPNVLASLPPLTAEEMTHTAPIPHPGFTCSGPATVSQDAANDVRDETKSTEKSAGPAVSAPWVDIRRVALYDLKGHHPCIEVTFGSQVRAGTLLHIFTDEEPIVADLAFGDTGLVPWEGLVAERQPYGEEGSTIRFLMPAGEAPNGLEICAVQSAYVQPLLGGRLYAPEDEWNVPRVDELPRHCG